MTKILILSLLITPVAQATEFEDDCHREVPGAQDKAWKNFELEVPKCDRAAMRLRVGATLDLGERPSVTKSPFGSRLFKVTILEGTASFADGRPAQDLRGVTAWLSQSICDIRALEMTDARKRDVASVHEARYFRTTQEVDIALNGNDVEGFRPECRPKN